MRSNTLLALAILALIATPDTSCAGWVYDPDVMHFEVIDLAAGDQHTGAYSINDSGQAVGTIGLNHVLFDMTGQGSHVNLGAHMGPYPKAICINDAGQIAWSTGGQSRATFRESNGQSVEIGTMESYPFSINNLGQVVGSDGYPVIRATLFDVTGQGDNRWLSFEFSRAWGINDEGQIVGEVNQQAASFDPTGNGDNLNLGTLGGEFSKAACINDSGQIVGWAETSSGALHATLFDPTGNGENIDLGTLFGNSSAKSINEDGVIVGSSHDGGTADSYRATLFTDEGPLDLNTLIGRRHERTLLRAYDINRDGWIAGQALYDDGLYHAIVLKPMSGAVPEPATVLLLGLGAAYLRRKSRPRHYSVGS